MIPAPADRVVTVKGTAELARQGIWPMSRRTHVGYLESGAPVSVYVGTVIVDMRPEKNRKKI